MLPFQDAPRSRAGQSRPHVLYSQKNNAGGDGVELRELLGIRPGVTALAGGGIALLLTPLIRRAARR